MKSLSTGQWTRSMLALVAVAFALAAQAQETMLGSHGGARQSGTPGAISTVNQSNANRMLIGTPYPGVGITGLATDSDGRVFASTGSEEGADSGPRLIEVDPATGNLLSNVGRLQTSGGEDCYVGDLSFQPGTDILFGILGNQSSGRCGLDPDASTGGYLVTIDTSNATVTVVGRDPSLGNSNGGLAFHPDGTLFFTPCWDDAGRLITLNPATAAVQSSVALAPDTCYMGLAVRPSDGRLFASYNWESSWDPYFIVTLNPDNGSETLVGYTRSTGIIHDLTFTDAIEVGFEINAGMSDSWYDPATAGQGFFLNVFEDTGIIFLAWFTYDIERPDEAADALLGEPGHRWVTAQGPWEGNTATLTAYLSEGGVFDMAEPAAAAPVPIGTITIVWHDCENATVSYDLDPPGVTGEIAVQRVVTDNVSVCRALQP